MSVEAWSLMELPPYEMLPHATLSLMEDFTRPPRKRWHMTKIGT